MVKNPGWLLNNNLYKRLSDYKRLHSDKFNFFLSFGKNLYIYRCKICETYIIYITLTDDTGNRIHLNSVGVFFLRVPKSHMAG